MNCLLKKIAIKLYDLVEAEDYKDVVEANQRKTREIEKISRKLKDSETFLNKLPNILSSNHASIYDSFTDRNSNLCYICYIKGNHDDIFFITNIELTINNNSGYTHFPYIETKLSNNAIYISELHSNVHTTYKDKESPFENRGYATQLIKTMLHFYGKEFSTDQLNELTIKGSLSFVDAETDERKNKRNEFYKNLGFKIKFNDSSEKDGFFSSEYSVLLDTINQKVNNYWLK